MQKKIIALAVASLFSAQAWAIAVVAAHPVVVARPAPVSVARPAAPVAAKPAAVKAAPAAAETTSKPVVSPVIVPATSRPACTDERRKKGDC